jgi:putative FmdB family regulatory protein
MATYEYVCIVCEEKLTVQRSITDSDPGYMCSSCGSRMKKVYSMAQPVFKGSGFYRTDK